MKNTEKMFTKPDLMKFVLIYLVWDIHRLHKGDLKCLFELLESLQIINESFRMKKKLKK